MKLRSNKTGAFTKSNSVTFNPSDWAVTDGSTDWSQYPNQIPYDESAVYHTELTHTPSGDPDIGWKIRVGKGGQIYYISINGLGQIICPNRHFSPWNDDCMTTTLYSSDVANSDIQMGGTDSYANGYIHGSGMYIKPNMDPLNAKPFYSPLLDESFDASDNSYSVVNYGLVPKPSVNRSDTLFYSRYRDLGHGVLELTFYCYNFGQRNYNFAETPWFAVRPSKFPNMIEGISGSSTFKTNNRLFGSGAIPSNGGWGAFTVNPSDKNSLTCALVWGSNTPQMAINFGVVNTGSRDMALISPSKSGLTIPYGTGIRYRRYLVFGKLENVSNICSKLNAHATLETFQFSKSTAGRLPLYLNTRDGQMIYSKGGSGTPVAHTFPIPVQHSLPLFLMKNTQTGTYFLSTDAYAACGKLPFVNPYPVGHSKHNLYQNRHVYQIYDGKTEWVELLGFVLPLNESELSSGYVQASDAFSAVPFIAGESAPASALMTPI